MAMEVDQLSDAEYRACMAECRSLRRAMFYEDRDFAIAGLLEQVRLAERSIQMLPEKFHAPFLAMLTVGTDALKHLRADTRPRDYWIGDSADFIEAANLESAQSNLAAAGARDEA